MTFLWAILIGLVLGVASGFLTRGRRDPGSIITRALVGIFGGVIGAVIATAIMPATGTDIVISAIGVVVLLFIYGLLIGNRKTP